MPDKIYISNEDYQILFEYYNKRTVYYYNGEATLAIYDLDDVVKTVEDKYTGEQLEILKTFCLSHCAINEINKEIGSLIRERMNYEDTIEKLKDGIVIGDEFNDILPNNKGEM